MLDQTLQMHGVVVVVASVYNIQDHFANKVSHRATKRKIDPIREDWSVVAGITQEPLKARMGLKS